MACVIRDYQRNDEDAVRACVVALQNFERTIEPRLRPGETMAEEYLAQLVKRGREADGRIFVAQDGDAVVGFVSVLARESFTELDDPPGTFAVVTDLVVRESHRHRGIGRQLLQRAESFARSAGARELRIGVLTRNAVARQLYLTADFAPYHEIFSKPLR